jgi:hypothetical protein
MPTSAEVAQGLLDQEDAATNHQHWLIEQVSGYIAYYGRRSIDQVDLPGFLEGLGIDPDQFGDREDG